MSEEKLNKYQRAVILLREKIAAQGIGRKALVRTYNRIVMVTGLSEYEPFLDNSGKVSSIKTLDRKGSVNK